MLAMQETDFMMAMQNYAQNPQMAQFIAAAQQGKMKQNTPSKSTLDRTTVLKCIDVNIELLKQQSSNPKLKELMNNLPTD